MEEVITSVINTRALQNVFGTSDEHLRTIRKALNIRVIVDRDQIIVRSEDLEAVRRGAYLLEQLQRMADREGAVLSSDDIQRCLSEVMQSQEISQIRPMEVYGGQRIRPKTAGQAKYVELLRQKEIVFCTGPAGTGKTYLAVARAVEALRTEGIRKIVLVRPAVEAGESLGFLPGDLQAKINPYLRPLFDSLADMMDHEMLQRFMAEDRIEVIPLAYMRGRTINSACIILDEAQNTTVSQMKMFLTRMGDHSRIAVCGDATQTDLPINKKSGLVDALQRLKQIPEIGVIALNETDIVRHSLVQKIVNAYETEESKTFEFSKNLRNASFPNGEKWSKEISDSSSGENNCAPSVSVPVRSGETVPTSLSE